MKEYKYIFSIIVPLYNTGEYLEECFGSLVNQTIGFDKIQLIIINDESPDINDETISLEYLNKYPDNIVYEKQKNTGEGGARNSGYKYIEGKYVGFLDADDKFGLDVFEKVYNYFEINYDEISLINIPIENFEAKEGLFHRYRDLREISGILDIISFPKLDHSFVTNWFYKNEVIKKYLSDETIRWGDDFKLINTIVLDEIKYGYLSDCRLYYRVRKKFNSGTNKFSENCFYYGGGLLEVFKFIVSYSQKKYKKVIPYIQNKYGILKEFFVETPLIKSNLILEGLNDEQASNLIEDRLDSLKYLVEFIDDEFMIDDIKIYFSIYALFLLNFKYNLNYKINNQINIKNLVEKSIIEDNIEMYCFLQYEKVYVNKEENMLVVELYINCPSTIRITNIIGKAEIFEEKSDIYRVDDHLVWDEICLSTYNAIFKMDIKKCIGKGVQFSLEIENELRTFSGIINIK